MSIATFDTDAINAYCEAGEIFVETMTDARGLIKLGVTQLEAAECAIGDVGAGVLAQHLD